MDKWVQRILICLIAVIAVFICYLLLPTEMTEYGSMDDGSSSYGKEDFIVDYVSVTAAKKNDEQGEDREGLVYAESRDVQSSIQSGDLTELAKAIAVNFKIKDNYKYNQTTQSVALNWNGSDITINGKTVLHNGSSHNDCSCFVSLMLYFSGADNEYKHRISNGFKYNTLTDAEVFGDLQVGDVIHTVMKGHVAIVVKIDENYVYTGDCGSTGTITDTAERGWGEKFAKTAKIDTWRSSSEIVERP